METRQIHVRDLSTVTGIQQYEHCVQSIFFLGLEDFEGTIYLSLESDKFSEDVALTNNTFIIGQPMTKFNATYTCQIYGVLNDGEKIQLSKRFRLIVDKSNNISGEAGEYPIDPNLTNGINQYITEKESQIDDYVEQVIASIPSDYSTLSNAIMQKVTDFQWTIGSVASSQNGIVDTSSFLNRIVNYRTLTIDEFIDASTGTGSQISPNLYDENNDLLGNLGAWVTACTKEQCVQAFPNAKYVKIIFRKANNANCSLDDIETYSLTVNAQITKNSPISVITWENAVINTSDGNITGVNDNTFLRSACLLKVEENTKYFLNLVENTSADYTLYVFFYKNNTLTRSSMDSNFIGYGIVNNLNFEAPSDCKYVAFLVRGGSTQLSPSDIESALVIYNGKTTENLNNYILSPSFTKIPVSATKLGTLAYKQAFCLYNSKYYSIENGHIGVQNSSFALESDETINVGHGNSIQRGNSNLAYACGWDDQKIYVVDLDDVVVTETITLPTTGYTTGVVDDLNNIAYIFQRNTYPNTVENYNFVAYDIANEQILYQKKIKAFGALQACDFHAGKIYALYGLHNATIPNGGFVCDVNGTILSEFIIPTLISDEIEGIAIDRATNKILFSGLNKNLYELVEV